MLSAHPFKGCSGARPKAENGMLLSGLDIDGSLANMPAFDGAINTVEPTELCMPEGSAQRGTDASQPPEAVATHLSGKLASAQHEPAHMQAQRACDPASSKPVRTARPVPADRTEHGLMSCRAAPRPAKRCSAPCMASSRSSSAPSQACQTVTMVGTWDSEQSWPRLNSTS
jgi:hypothetical protein